MTDIIASCEQGNGQRDLELTSIGGQQDLMASP